jgi:hypothetical protein
LRLWCGEEEVVANVVEDVEHDMVPGACEAGQRRRRRRCEQSGQLRHAVDEGVDVCDEEGTAGKHLLAVGTGVHVIGPRRHEDPTLVEMHLCIVGHIDVDEVIAT